MINEENMLSVLMYLFENHMSTNCQIEADAKELGQLLEALGFEKAAIEHAFNWLDNLVLQTEYVIALPKSDSIRVFTQFEQHHLSQKAQKFLLSLEKQNILTAQTREVVINQLLSLETDEIDIEIIQWVTLMVLFHREDQDNSLSNMEFLVLQDESTVH